MGRLTRSLYHKGKADGTVDEETEAKAGALSFVLEARFGVIPDSVRQRIFVATLSEIDSWRVRADKAPDMQSVFETR